MTDKRRFTEVPLKGLVEHGVLMAANELFFWPMGLALTWFVDDDGSVHDLHVRQWEQDGEWIREPIESEHDEAWLQRREAWADYVVERLGKLSPEDLAAAEERSRAFRKGVLVP